MKDGVENPIRSRQPRADSTTFKAKIVLMAVFLGLILYAMFKLNS